MYRPRWIGGCPYAVNLSHRHCLLDSMGLETEQRDHRYLLRCAGELLGVPVRAVNFAWEIQQRLQKQFHLVRMEGLDTPEPLVEIDTSTGGIDVDAGLVHYRLAGLWPPLDLVRVRGGVSSCGYSPRFDFWAVPVADYQRLFRYVRRRNRQAGRQPPPVMTEAQHDILWNNTVGFLKQSVQVLAKFGVAQRRGVLLSGPPGNGKTMASRWLRQECRRHRLAWRTVSAQEYEEACRENSLCTLFALRRPGIVQFDDLDLHLRDRNQHGPTGGHSVLLTELDGIEPRHGVVTLFTTNARLGQLDPAIRRPGRIDQVVEFPRPDARLRRQLVRETWHADLRAALDVEHVVTVTAGLSFAELEEVKKLLVLRFLETNRWQWEVAWQQFCQGRQSGSTRPIGFQQGHSGALSTDPQMGISACSSLNR